MNQSRTKCIPHVHTHTHTHTNTHTASRGQQGHELSDLSGLMRIIQPQIFMFY